MIFSDNLKIKAAFAKIRKSIQGKPYQRHVIPKFYAIENSLGEDDKEVRSHDIYYQNKANCSFYWSMSLIYAEISLLKEKFRKAQIDTESKANQN